MTKDSTYKYNHDGNTQGSGSYWKFSQESQDINK